MKKLPIVLLTVLAVLPGCIGSKKEKSAKVESTKKRQMTQVDIPMNDEGLKSFFDEDVNEFMLAEDDSDNAQGQAVNVAQTEQDFSWVEETAEQSGDLAVINFAFDSAAVTADQNKKLEKNAQALKQQLELAEKEGRAAAVRVEGHACHSAGSAAYNMAKSEQRARSVADRLETAGISKDKLHLVGYGAEVPVVVQGKKVTGDRAQQAVNRRVELHVTA